MNKVLLIGAGGVGSYLAAFLFRAIRTGALEIGAVTIADFDVVEQKNLAYQDYGEKDVGKNKAAIIAKRYGFGTVQEPITDAKQLGGFDLVIVAVDNNKTRMLVKNSGRRFLDVRAKGTMIAVFTEGSEDYEKFTPLTKDTADSCQFTHAKDTGAVDYGNIAAASCGMQYLKNIQEKRPTPTILADMSCMMLR